MLWHKNLMIRVKTGGKDSSKKTSREDSHWDFHHYSGSKVEFGRYWSNHIAALCRIDIFCRACRARPKMGRFPETEQKNCFLFSVSVFSETEHLKIWQSGVVEHRQAQALGPPGSGLGNLTSTRCDPCILRTTSLMWENFGPGLVIRSIAGQWLRRCAEHCGVLYLSILSCHGRGVLGGGVGG